MLLNHDLTIRTVVHAAGLEWVPSPARGVERRMLSRVGEEKARATSIVRYAPGSHFSQHSHPGGEEFLVLEGTFQDETGDFPVGTYVRNPPGSHHAPSSKSGCTLFVKLWQFKTEDRERVVRLPGEGNSADVRRGVTSSVMLFDCSDEQVMLQEWRPGAEVELTNPAGLELLVLTGAFVNGTDTLGRWSWLRLPAGESLRAKVGTEGVRIWLKSGPLLHPNVCAYPGGTVGA